MTITTQTPAVAHWYEVQPTGQILAYGGTDRAEAVNQTIIFLARNEDVEIYAERLPEGWNKPGNHTHCGTPDPDEAYKVMFDARVQLAEANQAAAIPLALLETVVYDVTIEQCHDCDTPLVHVHANEIDDRPRDGSNDELVAVTAPKPCDCPDDAKETLGNVIVTGHTSRCVHGEPRRYVWLDGGEMYVGTLADWARSWEFAERDDALGELSFEIRTWEESFQVEVTNLGTDDEDWTKYALSVGNETAYASVDGRV